ncbi:MAG: folylpolyglutamate synthase/dihydrofolate synthase family protein [Candidatus Omnitrophota bacterium]
MSYLKALGYAESFTNYEKHSRYSYKEALGLERIRSFLDLIHNPQAGLKSIHIAGTKGKGSSSAFIAYMLREAGFKSGLYTSPHLSDFRERIRILKPHPASGIRHPEFEGMIPKRAFAALVSRLKPAIEKHNRISRYGPLTFFEVCTAIAFCYFKEENVDFAVLETGLGGRLDATNVVNPLVSVITPISCEHMDKLGHTLSKIAAEKAGIIKGCRPRVEGYGGGATLSASRYLHPVICVPPVVSAPQKEEALAVIRNKCKKERAKLSVVGKDIKYSGREGSFRVSSSYGEYQGLKIRLIGAHQLANAVTALTAIESLRAYGIKLGIDSIRRGLYNTLWPGRCEVASRKPFIVLDGAHNPASASALKKTIREKFRYRRLILVLGVSNDKDIKAIALQLYDLADTVILTKAKSPRAASPYALKKYFKSKPVQVTDSVEQARDLALSISSGEDLVLVTGSLLVVGEARDNLKRWSTTI